MGETMERYMSTVKIGPKGQVVIPKEVRSMFGLEPGDSLVIMADVQRGIALQCPEVLEQVSKTIFAEAPAFRQGESQEELHKFASAVQEMIVKGEIRE